MAQPSPFEANGASTPVSDDDGHLSLPGKRKRDSSDDGADGAETNHDEKTSVLPESWAAGEDKSMIKSYFEVLKSFDRESEILTRSLPNNENKDEPDLKRQKGADPSSSLPTISDKIAEDAYLHIDDLVTDVMSAADAALSDLRSKTPDGSGSVATTKAIVRIQEFRQKAIALVNREKAYPKTPMQTGIDAENIKTASNKSQAILSVVGYAPQERRLFSSLPLSQDIDVTDFDLPPGVSFSRVVAADPQERVQTLGEVFGPPKPLPPLQPPKQPKTQAKGNVLDFYHPELADTTKLRGNNYFNTKLSAGHYLDYSNATPSSQTKMKQRERAQSLAGKKPSTSELEMSEMESLFRGAFSSFAPCKDDSAAIIPSVVAGRMWWQRTGLRNFQKTIEIEYYEDIDTSDVFSRKIAPEVLDEAEVQKAIDSWDDSVIDPSLEDAMGSKRDDSEKEVDDILDEVSDLIETLASYQRIRNLTLPNSQNRQSSDPVNGDMLANSGPHPSEEEQATYEMLKAQLALIIKTLPPYAVAKLNGDQLDDLLISTKIQVQTDQYRGVMEEDDAGVQARIRAQQQAAAQAAQAQAAQAASRPAPQRTPSISTPYGAQYQHQNQYATPNRTPSHPQQYFRAMPTPNYPQQRNMTSPVQQRPPQPNQYTRPNGYPNQYAAQHATQLAKAQTPYGHQNMPQFANQQRPQYGQLQQQATPNAVRYNYQQNYQHQAATPGQSNYAAYPNGAGMPPRNMSPQVPQRHAYSPTGNMTQTPPQRYNTPGQPNTQQHSRHGSNPGQQVQYNQAPGLTGYHTVIPEAQQQRILDQAKARVAAQERSAMFGDKMSHPGMGYGGNIDANRIAAARANLMNQQKPHTPVGQRSGSINGTPGSQYVPPSKVTPVPVPAIPGAGHQSQQQSPPPPQQPQQQQQSQLSPTEQ